MNLTQLFASNQTSRRQQPKQQSRVARDARYMAARICSGFQLHDRGQRVEAHEAFAAVEYRDVHTRRDWKKAIRVMTTYYEAILGAHQGERM